MVKAIALTSGEPSGIGIDIALAAWRELQAEQPFFLIGDRRHAAGRLGLSAIAEIEAPEEAASAMNAGLPLLHFEFPAPAEPGEVALKNANATSRSIEFAARLALDKRVSAICTNPVDKAILRTGTRFPFPGQTEFLGNICKVNRPVMMMASPVLRVVPVTTHIPVSEVSRNLSRELMESTIRVCHSALKSEFSIKSPRIAVSGLNPHAGEKGELGREETEKIAPAIGQLVAEGIDLSGPLPADTLFHEEARREYDAVICMYHDQALVPFKALDFYGGVNVTLGLPIVRTSPDHGTATNLVGTGKARPDSLIAALSLAGKLARARHMA